MKSKIGAVENIIPACYAETILIETLGFRCHDNHQMGDGNAINALQKNKNVKAIAVMDRPIGIAPSQIRSEYKDYKTGTHHLYLKKHKSKNHYIIYIDKVLEEWIFELGKSTKVKSPYKNMEALKSELKPSSSLNNNRLLKYFSDIQSKKPLPFKTINNWINELNK